MRPRTPIYGVMAEFETAEQVLEAAKRTREAGYRYTDAYAPYIVDGLSEEVGLPRTRVPIVVFCAGLVGAAAGFGMQYYTMAVNYPFNVAGRPTNSWPVFIPITFEVMILVSGFAALFALLFLCGLPQPYHPVFNVPRFAQASQDRFFLCIEAIDPRFDREGARRFLEGLNPAGVYEVPHYPEPEPGVEGGRV
jgi:hypothetical protein